MSDQLSKLLQKKSQYEQLYEDTQTLLIQIKQENDNLQRNQDVEFDGNIQITFKLQQSTMIPLIEDAKKKILDLAILSKAYDQKKQTKKLKDFLQKELERNKQIIKDQKNYTVNNKSDESDEEDKETSINQGGNQQIIKQEQFKLELDKQLIHERGYEINHIEKETIKLNSMMNEIAAKVDDQDQQLDIIKDDVFKTQENVVNANKEIQEANQRSRDAKKKYLMFSLLAFLIASIIIVYFLYFDIFY